MKHFSFHYLASLGARGEGGGNFTTGIKREETNYKFGG
jgi:hypothetical protein